jgi:hypothetical protein
MEAFMHYYDVTPLIVAADEFSTVTIRPRYEHAKFPQAELLELRFFAQEGLNYDPETEQSRWQPGKPDNIKDWKLLPDGSIVMQAFFPGEQEHVLQVRGYAEADKKLQRSIRSFRFYSLQKDLLNLQPLKGDFHIHSSGSDGAQDALYVAARYREAGFDFCAISDHRNYEPSLRAIDYWQKHFEDFRLYPGEEVHSTGNPVHIINFASSFSVNKKCFDDEAKYRQEVAAYLENIEQTDTRLDYFPVAASEWVFDQIRAGGGLAVFCHPYWYYQFKSAINEGIIDAMFQRRRFDAFELIGGFHRHQYRSNNLQIVRWCEESAKGNRFPVVGVSDSHGTDTYPLSGSGDFAHGISYSETRDGNLFNWYYTVVLAKENSREGIIEAIKSQRCAAIEAPPNERAHAYGDLRITRYISFLLREYFPPHQRYCQTQGALMLRHLAGENNLLQSIREMDAAVAKFRKTSLNFGH